MASHRSSNSRSQAIQNPSTTKDGRSLLRLIRFVVSVWYGYVDLHSWAIVGYFLILLITKSLFTWFGLALVLIIMVYVLLRYLHKKFEEIDV